MATSSTRKQCVNANGCKQMAAALCEGCSQALCTKHFIDHRRFLGEEMNVMISEHDQLQHTLNQQTKNPGSHALINQIDQWEKESIVKIQQKATVLREELLQLVTVQLHELSKNLRHLSERVKEVREEDSFIETDLQDWKKSLDNLKADLISPSTFSISQQDKNPLVQNICLNLVGNNDIFERVSENRVRIEENGLVAIRDTSINNCIEVRGKKEYTSGLHEIRLSIEQSTASWIFLGINSKSTPLQRDSYRSRSTYGWSNNNNFWVGGTFGGNAGAKIEMETNDTIILTFDCDAHKISMINERTNAKNELAVDTNNCSFPWQLHVILYEPNSCVRIL